DYVHDAVELQSLAPASLLKHRHEADTDQLLVSHPGEKIRHLLRLHTDLGHGHATQDNHNIGLKAALLPQLHPPFSGDQPSRFFTIKAWNKGQLLFPYRIAQK